MPLLQTYRDLPEIVTGYPLDDVWAVLVPIARTNIITNGSFETNTTSWTAIGGSIARSTTQQYHGAYSLAITPTATTTDGARFDTVSLTSGTTYAYSAKLRGVAGLQYSLSIETTGGVALSTKTFVASGRWQWIVGYYAETSSTTRRVTARKAGSNASTAIFYLDGVQVEAIVAGELASTYIDGDQLGLVPNQNPAPYVWNGTPHASSSARTALTRAGGMVYPFKRYGFLLTAMVGLGLAGAQNIATDYARIDGGYDDYTRKPSRQFTLTGRFQGRTYAELRRNRGGMAQLLDRDLVGQDQRLTLLRHVEDRNGNILTSDIRLLAKYQGGLEGSTDNMHAQTTPITFTQYLPNITSDGEAGSALNVQTSIGSSAQGILQRSAAGVWAAMGTGGTSGGASTIVQGLDGKIYAGGDFTAMGGVANTNAIAVWDPVAGSWAAMGTGAAGGTVVYSLSVLPSGNIVAVGNFTSMGGVANTSRIAMWNGSAWSSISSAFVGTEIVSSAVSAAGILYVGGTFTSVGGTAATNITSYNPVSTAWAAVGAGIAAGGVFDIACTGTTIYAAVEASGVYRSTGGNFSSIGATTTEPNSLALDAAGNLYAAGNFTIIGGVSANNIAKWNGIAWTPLGSGLTGGVVARNALFFDAQGMLTVGGTFTTAGGIVVPGRSARWNGSTWTFIDVIPDAGSPTIRTGLLANTGVFYLGLNNTAGTATAAATTTITNSGTAKTYPTLVIKGPSSSTARIYEITDYTTGRAIYLNLTINAGETCKLVFQPDNLSFTSDFQGNIASAILGGSNEADFFLQPGVNSISFFSASSTVTATLIWRTAYASMDDVQ